MSVCVASHLGDARQIFANVVYNQQGPQIQWHLCCFKWLISLENCLCTISLSFHFISTAQRDVFFFFLITLSFLPSRQKLTAEEEKENKIQNNKGVLVPLLSPDLNLKGHCSEPKLWVVLFHHYRASRTRS